MVIVFDRLNVAGWAGQEPCDVPEQRCEKLEDVLDKRVRGELLVAGYGRESGENLPRLNKGALGRFARHDDIRLQAILIDIDYEDHEIPPDGWHKEVLADVPEMFPEPGWYRTPHGMRLVWKLEQSLPLIVADSAIQCVHHALNEAGIETDLPTSDWTRMQRCPHAFNYDLPKGNLDDIPTIDLDEDKLEEGSPHPLGTHIDCDRPGPVDDVTRKELNPVKSVSDQLADKLYRGALSAKKGDRHDTLLRTAITVAFANETDDPRVPYRALYASCQAMEKPLEELWRICKWAAAAHDAHEKEQHEQMVEAKRETAEVLGCPENMAQQRAILDSGSEYFVWDESEKAYSSAYQNQRQLLAALKLHCPILARDVIWDSTPINEILRDYSSPLDSIVYSYINDKSKYNEERNELVVPCARVDRNLVPEYSEEIDEWLQGLLGDEHYHDGLRWLAACPRLNRPVCALYLQGPDSIGKGMLASGIARLWSPHSETTPYQDLIKNFQGKLLKTPMIVADEKVPQDAFSNNDSSVFRRLVGNGTHPVNQKNKSKVTLVGYPRVLITANNEDALNIREDLDQNDLKAVKKRVGYIDRDEDRSAQEVIERLAIENGHTSTYDYTEQWVQEGIAQHILWLEENYEYEEDDRFVVEGWDSEFTDNLVTSVGSAGSIAETICLAIEKGDYNPAVRWFGGDIYVNSSLLAAEWENIRGHNVDKAPSSNGRLKALRSLSEGEKKRIRDRSGKQKRYWVIPARSMASLAEDRNLASSDKILESCGRPRSEEEEGHYGSDIKEVDFGG